jgi:hypothetical protein
VAPVDSIHVFQAVRKKASHVRLELNKATKLQHLVKATLDNTHGQESRSFAVSLLAWQIEFLQNQILPPFLERIKSV